MHDTIFSRHKSSELGMSENLRGVGSRLFHMSPQLHYIKFIDKGPEMGSREIFNEAVYLSRGDTPVTTSK